MPLCSPWTLHAPPYSPSIFVQRIAASSLVTAAAGVCLGPQARRLRAAGAGGGGAGGRAQALQVRAKIEFDRQRLGLGCRLMKAVRRGHGLWYIWVSRAARRFRSRPQPAAAIIAAIIAAINVVINAVIDAVDAVEQQPRNHAASLATAIGCVVMDRQDVSCARSLW
eukprot:CAMPEP_0181254780 /NCGR_PEP_ID=MMETSP1096-20121128/48791_1 /TAXON_ID=156174 ORGANISM="Chrysochromulina ericina, Strain CCMP281" /NCGR_SAMPLE_ID=MMETSP1096 /ASSEMBLY_ACC=CAM_ASM_000453 /LENGTH=166 /DNA_ID=CAMNT_0023352849 /DNA_START=170 /DNA_END=671 /DNA_ORIENTATION=+